MPQPGSSPRHLPQQLQDLGLHLRDVRLDFFERPGRRAGHHASVADDEVLPRPPSSLRFLAWRSRARGRRCRGPRGVVVESTQVGVRGGADLQGVVQPGEIAVRSVASELGPEFKLVDLRPEVSGPAEDLLPGVLCGLQFLRIVELRPIPRLESPPLWLHQPCNLFSERFRAFGEEGLHPGQLIHGLRDTLVHPRQGVDHPRMDPVQVSIPDRLVVEDAISQFPKLVQASQNPGPASVLFGNERESLWSQPGP